jgi:protoporphyrinogen oxidase
VPDSQTGSPKAKNGAPKNVVVLGGGVAGLSAAHYLSRDGHRVTVVEKAPQTGGLCASFESHGFTLDYGPHKMYSVVPGVLDELRAIMGDELIEHKKRNRIRLLGRYLSYPLSLGNLLPLLGPVRSVKMGLDYAGSLAAGVLNGKPSRTYEDYVVRRFGRSVYELVFAPLAWKVWGDPSQLAAELAEARIPSGGATDLILRLLKLKQSTPDVDAPYFYYPKSGFGAFPAKLASNVTAASGRILTGASVVGVEREGSQVTGLRVRHAGSSENDELLPCDLLVSSIPIHTLSDMLGVGDAQADANLRSRQLLLVYLVIDEERVLDDHWVFFPEREFPFSRLFEQKAMSEELGPKGKTVLCCDLTCDLDDDLWKSSDEDLAKRCLRAVESVGVTTEDRLSGSFVKRFRDFYPVYSIDYRKRLSERYESLRVVDNLIPTGRLGMFNYNNSDHCLDMGRFIAQGVDKGDTPGDIWDALEQRVRSYRIVD